jgi:hypothetical protein
MSEEKEMQLSTQAMGALMMALQRSLMEQEDIVPVLEGLKFKLNDEGLVVLNPPTVMLKPDFEDA